VALDVGANIGTHTVFLSQRFARVHAFEPNPMLHHVLSANIALNQLKGVTAHRLALSDRNERLIYIQSRDGNLGGSFFQRSGEVVAGSEIMALVRGDETLMSCLKTGERVVFAKIDVEGLEDKVVAGLSGLLRRDRPLLVIEVAGAQNGERVRDVLADLSYYYLYEIHNPARFNPAGFSAGLARALAHGIDYELKPLREFEARLYPMVVASPVDLMA
jgi:FkbM family methyltransferase